jgi:hypothetical protein
MSILRYFGLVPLCFAVLIGCAKTTDKPKSNASNTASSDAKPKEVTPAQQAKIQSSLAKLSDADRALAIAQKFCPIQNSRLGSMGKPDRIEIEGQPVFLCCAGCEDEARADAKKTLEQVAKLKQGLK